MENSSVVHTADELTSAKVTPDTLHQHLGPCIPGVDPRAAGPLEAAMHWPETGRPALGTFPCKPRPEDRSGADCLVGSNVEVQRWDEMSASGENTVPPGPWQWIAAYPAYRFSLREVVRTVELHGEWRTPLAPMEMRFGKARAGKAVTAHGQVEHILINHAAPFGRVGRRISLRSDNCLRHRTRTEGAFAFQIRCEKPAPVAATRH